MKTVFHRNLMFYILHSLKSVSYTHLIEEYEPGVKNVNAACKAMLEVMLEGDYFVVEPKSKSKCAYALTIRYYVDNLSPERKTYAEANA